MKILIGTLATALMVGCGGGGDAQITPTPPTPPTDTPVTLAVERVFPSLSFTSPVALLQAPQDSSRWFVVEKAGRVAVFANSSATTSSAAFVDISGRVAAGGEGGLLGMAFHPGFPATPKVYLSYTAPASGTVISRISEFSLLDADTLDPNSERILLSVNQPSGEDNHKGGNIAFGPGGYLYIGFGDGGGGDDQHGSTGNAQLMTTLLGKMLRINVDVAPGGVNYSIPGDNLFSGNVRCGTNGTGTQNCPEIYAYGFRNPWRWSFDRQTGQLWVGDVGQGAREEVDRVTNGGNYGWRCLEGTRNTGMDCGTPPASPSAPVAEYDHTLNRLSITGGYVYRGTAIPALVGRYVFGDFGSGTIWNIAADTAPTLTVTGGQASGLDIASFAQGNDGELYVVHLGGTLHRIKTP